jgi:hypothetical protein
MRLHHAQNPTVSPLRGPSGSSSAWYGRFSTSSNQVVNTTPPLGCGSIRSFACRRISGESQR